jgi:hypothetical protein
VTLHHYLLHGLPIASEIPLPELELFPPPKREAKDDTVRLNILRAPIEGPVPEGLPEGMRIVAKSTYENRVRWCAAQSLTGDWIVRWSGVVEIRMNREATRAIVVADPSADPGLITVLLGASTLAFALTVRKHLVLHASCVSIDGSAIAIVADSGGGKSTLSALLCAAGASFVTDDVLRIDLPSASSGDWVAGRTEPKRSLSTAHRGSRELRLRPTAPEVGDLLAQFAQRSTADERTAIQVPQYGHATIPLGRIVLPILHPELDAVAAERLKPTEALLSLLNKLRVPDVIDAEFHESQFVQLAELVSNVEVYRLHLPWTRPFTQEVAKTYIEAITA